MQAPSPAKHAGASPTYEGDDLVYSGGEGSGCWDDEDDCGEVESTTYLMRPPPVYPIIPQQTPRPPELTPSRTPPSVYGVPIPDMPAMGKERHKPPPKVKTFSAADNTAMVIGITAGVLIVVVIVALVVYRVRSWTLAATPGVGVYKGGGADEAAQKRYTSHRPPTQRPTSRDNRYSST